MTPTQFVNLANGQTAGLDQRAREIDSAIRRGLPNEAKDLECHRRSKAYYKLKGAKFIPRRDAETLVSLANRPRRSLPFTKRVVNLLCSKLYAPGPARKFEDDAINTFMDGVYRDNLINARWQKADRYSHLHGIAAFQVGATGDPRKPIRIHVWTRDEFVPFRDPDDSLVIRDVVTRRRYDEQTTYTWWSADMIRVYQTPKLGLGQTSGGRVPRLVSSEPNPYGVLPFSFVHFELPDGDCEENGLGQYLSEINLTIDCEASDMAQAVQCYHTPLPVMYGADADTRIVKSPGGWVKITYDPSKDFGSNTPPKLEYLQAQLDIEGGWLNIRTAIDTVLEGLGIPESMYRLNQATLPSGVAQIAEQQPITDYAIQRQEPFRQYEQDLARIILVAAGNYYGNGDLVAAADDPNLSISWPPSQITMPGPERDQQDEDAVSLGVESIVDIAMRRFGLTERQAWQRLEKVAADNKRLASMGLDAQPQIQPLETNRLDSNSPAETADNGSTPEPQT